MEGWVLPSAEEARLIREAETQMRLADEASELERRRLERMAYQARISVSSETNFFVSFSENLSHGGVFIATYSPPRIGERIWMQVSVEGAGEVTLEGVVRWHRTGEDGCPTGCGVQFVDLDVNSEGQVAALLGSMQRDPLLADLD